MSYNKQFPPSLVINNRLWRQEDNPGPVAGDQMKSGTYQQSINVIYLLLWIHLCHLKMCQSLCCHFAFPAALNVWAGSAFLWLGFEVIVLLSHLSNYVTSRESKTGQCTIHNSLAMTQICIKWHRRSCNNCLICCSHLKTYSSAFVCRRSEETVHLQIVFLSSFLVILLSSHLPDRTEPSNSPHQSSTTWNATKQSVSVHLFLGVWHFTQTFRALQPLLPCVHIMCSLCSYSKCLWRH